MSNAKKGVGQTFTASNEAWFTDPTKPFEFILKCNHSELNFKTDKGLEIHIGKPYKTISQQSPEKEHSSFLVKEPTFTITPI